MEVPYTRPRSASDEPERSTGSRYSFANASLSREDHVLTHPSSRIRMIEYPTPDPVHEAIRSKLRSAGILLGHLIGTEEGRDAFRVPPSTRPVIYDAQSAAHGAFSYGDDQLFYDLGELLAKTYQATEGGVLTADIGQNVAFVEFTQPAERRLFLVPGVEHTIEDVEPGVDPLTHYAAPLRQAFGAKFQDSAVYFQMGFNEAGN
jgi:hypothetical protein